MNNTNSRDEKLKILLEKNSITSIGNKTTNDARNTDLMINK